MHKVEFLNTQLWQNGGYFILIKILPKTKQQVILINFINHVYWYCLPKLNFRVNHFIRVTNNIAPVDERLWKLSHVWENQIKEVFENN